MYNGGGILIVVDVVIGYFISHFFAGRKPGQRGRMPSFRFRIKNMYIVHLHHWFLCTVVLIGLFVTDLYNTLVYGFLVGSAVQGLTYKDFYKLIYRHEEEKPDSAFDIAK